MTTHPPQLVDQYARPRVAPDFEHVVASDLTDQIEHDDPKRFAEQLQDGEMRLMKLVDGHRAFIAYAVVSRDFLRHSSPEMRTGMYRRQIEQAYRLWLAQQPSVPSVPS